MGNKTMAIDVILLGFSSDLITNICLFPIFFFLYVFTVVGNCLIICVVKLCPPLHTPMYFFLSNLSFIDLCVSSLAIPKLLVDLLSTHRTISVIGCLIQLNVLFFVETTQCQLLAVMAYDRYIAICRPLHYNVLMRWSVSCQLAAFVWILSFINVIIIPFVVPISICYPNNLDHFMCEILLLLKLSCNDTSGQELAVFSVGVIFLLLPFFLIIVSYVCIISTVLRIRSSGKSKAFSICTSHITVVATYFIISMVRFLNPLSKNSLNRNKYISIFYITISPMLNPLIYSLNNREVKKALIKLF